MSLYQIRPLGTRECLVAFELIRGRMAEQQGFRDVREEWTLWDPEGLPHPAYPDIEITRAMTGREVLEWQEQAWGEHVAMTRRLFGAVPLSGVPNAGVPSRGLLAFPIPYGSEKGRWTLRHRGGEYWNFTSAQIRDGMPRSVPPAGEWVEDR